jgi:type VI secretion system protein ImpH
MEANGRRGSDPVKDYGWGKAAAVEEWLFAEGHRFDFFQAVRLLEMIRAADGDEGADKMAGQGGDTGHNPQRHVSPGAGADPDRELVRFKSAVSLNFPASDIAKIRSGRKIKEPRQMVDHFKGEWRERQESRWSVIGDAGRNQTLGQDTVLGTRVWDRLRGRQAEMTVNFMGLAGSHGVLDTPTTELVLERAWRNDKTLRDFLDIFNHRLVSLLYRIRKHHRVGLGFTTPGQDQISRYLYSIIGLGTPGLQGRMQVRDRALLHYAGILAQRPRSLVGLERILRDYFQVEVKGRQFQGAWCELEESQWTAIGRSGRNQRLGHDTVVVGTRVWDQHAGFEVQLGPLTLKQFISFLPTGWRFGVLCDLIRFYVQNEFSFSIRLILKGAEIPESELRAPAPALAWTSWLGRSQLGSSQLSSDSAAEPLPISKEGNPYIVILPDSLRLETESIKSHVLMRLPRGKQSELFALMEEGRYPGNTVVMRQGDGGDCMYFIRRGSVQLFRRGDDGKETLVGVLSEGDSFGESALLTGKPQSVTALTATDCEISKLDKTQFDAFVAKYPSLGRTKEAYVSRLGQKTFR